MSKRQIGQLIYQDIPQKNLTSEKRINYTFVFRILKHLCLVSSLYLGTLIFGIVYAQSFFSMRGFGEEILCADAYANSLASIISLSRENPAYPLSLNKTNFFATVSNNLVIVKGNMWQRAIYEIRPSAIEGKIPLPYKFRIGLKLKENYNQNFDVYSESIPLAGYWARRHIIGQGGIYQVAINGAKTFLNNNLSLGINYSRIFGQGLEHWIFEITEENYITRETIITNYSARSLRFGLLSQISAITLGLHFEDILPGKIQEQIKSYAATAETSFMFNLPFSFGLGLSFNQLQNTAFYFDFFYKNWKKAQIKNNYVANFRNSMKYSVAIEHWLTANHPLRFGVRYNKSYLLDHTTYQIKEYGLTMGSRLPIPKFGTFDYSLELFSRQGRILKETVSRLNFSLAYEEVWKKRTRRWGY